MTNQLPNPEADKNAKLYEDILDQVRRVYKASDMETEMFNGEPSRWETESKRKRWGQPMRKISEYTPRNIHAQQPDRSGKRVQTVLVMPAADLDNGTPTQHLYFLYTDRTIGRYHETLEPSEDYPDEVEEFETLEYPYLNYSDDMPIAEKETLLRELEVLRDIDSNL